MSRITQLYWRLPEAGFAALGLRRRYVLVVAIAAALLTAFGADSSPVFADCDGDGSPGSC
jgi:hypothetical protein